jgi:transposase
MFALSPATRVFLRPGATDMRKSFTGLCALAEHRMKQGPTSGHLFVFCNRQRNRIKILYWDGSGLWCCAKRIEGGRASWPAQSGDCVEQTRAQLTMLLEGIELKDTRQKKWHRV